MRTHPAADRGQRHTGIDLYWIPLGAGGHGFVRLNGRLYESLTARREQRPPVRLYHTALTARTHEADFIVETAWPSPDAETNSRGVAVEGPVLSRRLARLRPFRYEVRCWQDGVIPDIGHAEASPQPLTNDPERAQHLLDLTTAVPAFTWGRDESRTGDMWNSNSVISWLLTRTGLPIEPIRPPNGGRAPGWNAGILIATSTNSRSNEL